MRSFTFILAVIITLISSPPSWADPTASPPQASATVSSSGAAFAAPVPAAAPAVTQPEAPAPVSCKAASFIQGFRISTLTTVGYSGPSHHVEPFLGGAAGPSYVAGVGLLPDSSCVPRLELEGVAYGTVGTSASTTAATNGAAFRLTPAGIIGVRLTGSWTAQGGAGFDMFNFGSTGVSGFGSPFSSIRNLSVYFGLSCDFGPPPAQPAIPTQLTTS